MPKMKTHSSAKKRFRLTATGKLKRKHAYKSHILTYIYGIGKSNAEKILQKAKVNKNIQVKDWTDKQINEIRKIISEKYKIEGTLRAEVQMNIKRLLDIGCYRGIRHRTGMPVRGQSTKNNARTKKGKRKTIANKKKAIKK